MTISMDKKYRTKSGFDVTLIGVDFAGAYPVMGYRISANGKKHIMSWTSDGIEGTWPGEDYLVEVKPSIKKTFWINVYTDYYLNLHPDRKTADQNAITNRIACYEYEIDIEEGHGL